MSHRFFHADRSRSLKVGQLLNVDQSGLSVFGSSYAHALSTKSPQDMTDAEQREYYLECIRKEPIFNNYTSRLSCLFGANTIQEAINYANEIEPRPLYDIPIYEVFSSNFWNLDTNWLDYKCDHIKRIEYLREYWHAAISNHNPSSDSRRPPRIEVLIALPAKIGEIVGWAKTTEQLS